MEMFLRVWAELLLELVKIFSKIFENSTVFGTSMKKLEVIPCGFFLIFDFSNLFLLEIFLTQIF